MSEQHLHIVSFNIPDPPDYGGVIDVFYKIKALVASGVKIHLHCFAYGRQRSRILEELCAEVFYYNRDKFWKGFLSDKPFIVESRNAPDLKKNLGRDQYPVLFEGLHTCFYLPDELLRNRLRMVRMHNNEAEYYLRLAEKETTFFKRLYFYAEYKRLMRFEQVLEFADQIFCISRHETAQYQKRFSQATYLGPFHGNYAADIVKGKGDYALYHGNLEINENIEAALYLCNEIFSGLQHPLTIAGNHPDPKLVTAIARYPHIKLVQNPSRQEMDELICNAHIHVLPTFMATGIKLKLVNALFNGRFCVVNPEMVNGTGLEKYCRVANDTVQMKNIITEIFEQTFSETDLAFRKNIENEFSDRAEAAKIVSLLQ